MSDNVEMRFVNSLQTFVEQYGKQVISLKVVFVRLQFVLNVQEDTQQL